MSGQCLLSYIPRANTPLKFKRRKKCEELLRYPGKVANIANFSSITLKYEVTLQAFRSKKSMDIF